MQLPQLRPSSFAKTLACRKGAWLGTLLFLATVCRAGVEPFTNSIKGALKAADTLVVKDEKFQSAQFNWGSIEKQNVRNYVTLQFFRDTILALPKEFTCEVRLKIEYLTSPDQTEPLVHNNVWLRIAYNRDSLLKNKDFDTYTFENAHWIKVTVEEVRSKEFGEKIPPQLQLTSQIIAERKYKFDPQREPGFFVERDGRATAKNKNAGTAPANGRFSTGGVTGGSIQLTWPGNPGDEEYDLEWTTLDWNGGYDSLLTSLTANQAVADAELNALFCNNATRITTQANHYAVTLAHYNSYLFFRLRAVHYDAATGLRIEGVWDYTQANPTNPSAAVYTLFDLGNDWHQSNLNWQFSAAYAEEGKKKEVITYFDGSLRSRQTLSRDNDYGNIIVQETVYDKFGRAGAVLLPAPINAGVFGYYPRQSLNSDGAVYSYKDLDKPYDSCNPLPQGLSTQSGASQYYSAQNPFLNNEPFNRYIPDAQTYPLAVTKYTADNTGRVRMQGGVGPVFQPSGETHATKYFYGKPYAEELDALFGSDAGYAEHYLKNMVVDANGQISVSYVDASGKTVATALTGGSPESLTELPSKPRPQTQTIRLIQPQQFQKDFTNLTLSATTTYLASVAGPVDLRFDLERLIYTYGQSNWQICSNCYYDLSIRLTDDCGNVIAVPNVPGIVGSAVSACSLSGIDSRVYNISFPKVGEYQVHFALAMSKKVMEDYLEEYIAARQAHDDWKTEFRFVKEYMLKEDFLNCFSDCRTCEKELGTQPQFIDNAKKQLADRGIAYSATDKGELNGFLTALYSTLWSQCAAQKAACMGSPCDRYRNLMLTDVSPGGQYALFAADGTPLETSLNVILNHWRADAFPPLPGSDPLYQGSLITLDDGTVISPYDANFTLAMLLQYWKSDWAEKFLPFHPEYCKLQFCNNNTVYFAWDRSVSDDISTAAQISTHSSTAGNSYQSNNPAWLVDSDPFFTNPSSPGYGLQSSVRADLTAYASRVLRLSQGADKSLTQFVDYQLYCADIDGNTNNGSSTDNWNNCSPNGNCRLPNREWEEYKGLYFELKEKYYNIARKATTCGGACGVGEDISLPAGCPSKNDFAVLDGDSTCPGGKKAVRFVSNRGPVGRTVTLTLAYAQGINTDGLPATVIFPKGALQVEERCLDEGIPLLAIYITGVSCSNNTTAIDDCPFGNGTTISLPAGSVQLSSTQFEYTNWRASYVQTYAFVAGTASNPPADDDYCSGGVVTTKQFFDCCLVYIEGNSASIQYTNVWVIGCQRPVSGNRGMPALPATPPQPANKLSKNLLPSSKNAAGAQVSRKPLIDGKRGSAVKPPRQPLPQVCLPTPYFSGTLTNTPCSLSQQNDGVLYTITTANGQPLPNGSYANIAVMLDFGSYGSIEPYKTVTLGSGGTSVSICISNQYLSEASSIYLCSDYVPPVTADCPPELKDKTPRFISFDYNVPGTHLNEQIGEGLQQAAQQIQSSCETQVDQLMAKLEPCLQQLSVGTPQKAALRQKLLEVCTKGGDLEHPYGASTTRPGEVSASGYTSFAQVIRQELGISLTDLCNPWLVESPYPWEHPAQPAEITLTKSSAAVCQKLAALQSDYAVAITGGSFHQYLKNRFGAANVNISETELAQLINSCTNCRFLLPKEIKQPVFLDPRAKGCITKTEWEAALTAFAGEFATGGISPTSPNYGDLLSTYLNHQWGFTFTYDQYEEYRGQLTNQPDAVLCNQPVYSTVEIPLYQCFNSLMANAITNGQREYELYVENEKRTFRSTYTTTCLGAKPNVGLTTARQEYHYTLYYYDGAGNLARTVPPEGVSLLSAAEVEQVERHREDPGTPPVYPSHTLLATYHYNSMGQVVWQSTPDGGGSRFWYDLLGRLVASQNAEQLSPANEGEPNRFSYTRYDALGRIVEVGEKEGADLNAAPGFLDPDEVKRFLNSGRNEQITLTQYDEPFAGRIGELQGLEQSNLRKRVAASFYRPVEDKDIEQGTYYSYDVAGNVKTLWQQIRGLEAKKIDYEYDLVSGKVNAVRYQHPAADRFYYQYDYDGENRLKTALSGTETIWNPTMQSSDLRNLPTTSMDAEYQYYRHGPLARVELGQRKVQGLDYAYTLQGWLKGINGQTLQAVQDMGLDATQGSSHDWVGKDVFGFSLGYYEGDYLPVGRSAAPAFSMAYRHRPSDEAGQALYNGNISHSTVALSKFRNGEPVGYTYRYDQLNRLVQMRYHELKRGSLQWDRSYLSPLYQESYSYDGNGNIQTLRRSGNNPRVPLMDDLEYEYFANSNRLRLVHETVPAGDYSDAVVKDMEDHGNEYQYENQGNLMRDVDEGIERIRWTVYGKIASIEKTDGTSIEYGYDAGGQRVRKRVFNPKQGQDDTTYYVRDAQGNTLAVYEGDGRKTEQYLYGSSRSGVWKAQGWGRSQSYREYELTNHLGNVVAVVSDRPIEMDGDGDGVVDYYAAEVLQQQDYYSFGMVMPGRNYTAGSTYRYGFNGKENDNEVKEEGNQQDYGLRIYDPRLARFLSVDPLEQEYPWNSTYSFAEGDPINFVDLDGAEKSKSEIQQIDKRNNTRLEVIRSNASLQTIALRGAADAVLGANTLGISEIFGTNLSDYSTDIEREAYLRGRIAGDAFASIQSMDEISMGGTMALSTGIQSGGIGTAVGVGIALHGVSVGVTTASDIGWALKELYKLNVQSSATNDVSNSTNQQAQSAHQSSKSSPKSNTNSKDPLPNYENPGHHDPSNPNFNKEKSVLPELHKELFEKSVQGSDKNRWTVVGKGKKAVFHRFQNDGNGNWHWNGSTDAKLIDGTPNPILEQNVPNDVKKLRNEKKKQG